MRRVYRILAYAIAVEVVIQAATIAWMLAGLGNWVQQGGVLDKSVMEDRGGPIPFPELLGIIIHGMNGQLLIPLLAVVMLIVAFFARIRHGIAIAASLVGLVALQVVLGMVAGGGVPISAMLHGANALLIFTAALLATRISRPDATERAASTRARAIG